MLIVVSVSMAASSPSLIVESVAIVLPPPHPAVAKTETRAKGAMILFNVFLPVESTDRSIGLSIGIMFLIKLKARF